MRTLALLASLTLSLAAVAGCIGAGPDGGSDDPFSDVPQASEQRLEAPEEDWASYVVADHGAPQMHAIRPLHEESVYLELEGYDPLSDHLPPEGQGVGWAALGIWNEYLCVTQFAGGGSVAIVDISEPSAPQVLSQTSDALTNGDCQFTADGKFLFAGAYLGAGPTIPANGVPFLEKGTPGGYGINIWDVSDKSDPQHVLFSDTGEYHTHHLWTDDEGTIWLVQAYSGNIYRFHPEEGSLEHVAQQTPMVHDMWIDRHPITGQTLLFTGEQSGFVIYDFDDPANTVDIAHWMPPEDIPRAQGWHRQELSMELIDDKVILVVSGEDCGAGTRPYIVVDVTDATDPITMGSWELPGAPVSTDAVHLCEFSSHEFSLHDGYLAAANYHAGVWLIDIGSAQRLLEPETIGFYMPHNEPLLEGGTQLSSWPWNPFVWGAQWDDRGFIYAADASSGLYVFRVPGISE